MIVYDNGSNGLRIVNLTAKTVTTFSPNPLQPLSIGNMVYRPKDNGLYFSNPDNQMLQKIDMKSGQVTVLLQKSSRLPNPTALCTANDQLFVADKNLPEVYQVDWGTNTMNAQNPGMLNKIGVGTHIQSLTALDDKVYALQNGSTPLALISPESTPVSFATVWGYMANNAIQDIVPMFDLKGGRAWPCHPVIPASFL